MVFEKFRKILEKQPEIIEVKRFTLEEAEKEVENRKGSTIEDAKNSAKPLLEEISKLRDELKKMTHDISKSESQENIHPRIYKAANQAKDMFTEKASRALNDMKLPSELSWENLQALVQPLARSVNLLGKVLVSQGRRVSILFSKKMQEYGRTVSALQVAAGRLTETIEKTKSKLSDLERVSNSVKLYHELGQKKKDTESRAENIRAQIKKLEAEITKKTNELEDLTGKEEYHLLESKDKRLSQIEEELKSIQSLMKSTISSISRPLRKLERLVADGHATLTKEDLSVLNDYLEDPFKAAKSEDESLSKLGVILEQLRLAIDGDKIKLPPREKRKKIEQISELIKGKTVASMRTKYEKLNAEAKTAREEMEKSPLLRKRSQLVRSLESLNGELKKLASDLDVSKDKLDEVSRELKGSKTKVRESVEKVLGAELKELQ